MFKEFMLVGMGSFFGGGMRFLLSKLIQSWAFVQFPLGTFAVNILGCLLLGFLSGLPLNIGWLSPSARLILTTGFCGGFTTFSTFMHENSSFLHNDSYLSLLLYVAASLSLGLFAVIGGHQLARVL